jgi:hypothetical protein
MVGFSPPRLGGFFGVMDMLSLDVAAGMREHEIGRRGRSNRMRKP